MSRSFGHFLTKLFSVSISYENSFNVLVTGLGAHLCYTFGTLEEKQIVIKEKYKFDSNGFTNFMLVDENGSHYKVANCLWFFKWDSIEDWTNLKQGSIYPLKFYGYRIPVLGLFPIIVGQSDKTMPLYVNIKGL